MGKIFNLTKSSELVGVSRMTLVRHIKKGKLSSTIDQHGKKGVEMSELIRCYGEIKGVDTDVMSTPVVTDVTHEQLNQCLELKQIYREQIRKLEENELYLKRILEHSMLRISDKSGSGKKVKGKKSKKSKKK
jgi:hypothetical protein